MFKRRISWGAGHFQLFTKAAFALIALALALSITTLAQNGQNHSDSALAAKVRALNNQLLALHGQFQQGLSGNGAAAARSQAATVIAARASALHSLIQQNPRAALSFAFSPELLADLANKFPNASSALETHTTLSGPVSHWVADYPDLENSRESWHMNTSAGTVDLYFGTQPPSTRGPAIIVTLTGVKIGNSVAVSKVSVTSIGGASAPDSLPDAFTRTPSFVPLLALVLLVAVWLALRTIWRARPVFKQFAACAVALAFLVSGPSAAMAQSCSTTGVQNVAVLLVNFSDVSISVTPQQAGYAFFGGDGGPSLSGYWQETSYGQTSATGNVFGPFTIGVSASYSCSNTLQVFYDTVSAANAAGLNLQNYSRIDIIFPGLSCGWAGLTMTGTAGAGCGTLSTAEGTLTASVTLNVASYFNTRSNAVSLVAHENGHQLGLYHDGTISDQPTSVLGPLSAPGTIGEFNDFFSVMGAWTLGHYGAPDKAETLGWLVPGANYQTVTTSGTYSIEPMETTPAGIKALKVQRGTGNGGYYLWIEYRQPIGSYDSTTSFMNSDGVLVHYETPNLASFGSYSGHTQVMDFTPSDVGVWYDTVLGAGKTWTDPYSDVSISVGSVNSSGATVNISYSGTSSCISSPPSVIVSPLDPSIYPGQTASYSVSVANNDSSGCSSSTINLASSQPSGWTTSFSSSSLTLSPGQSVSVTLGKGAPSGTSAGTYAVDLTASTASSMASGTANATVMTAPTLAASLSVSASSFLPPATASITASVTNGSTPVSGASVKFTLTTPNGTNTTQSATTGSNGLATWNYKLSGKSQVGSYSVTAAAYLGSGGKKNAATTSTQSAASNQVTFTVQ